MSTPCDIPAPVPVMTSAAAYEPPVYSLVAGGAFFRLCRKLRLAGEQLEFGPRRILVITLFVWLPLVFLVALTGGTVGDEIRIPFLFDMEAQARLLIALPFLLGAELVVHERNSPLLRFFVDRQIIATGDLPKFDAAVRSLLRVRNSLGLEFGLLFLVYTIGFWFWRNQATPGLTSWYLTRKGAESHLTPAGYWYAFVSIPIFQFFLLRWYARIFLWFQMLWRISRLHLRLTAAHPDHAGGIGFVGRNSDFFSPIVVAHGILLSGMIANRIFYEGKGLLSFKVDAAGLIVLLILFIFGPLAMFIPALTRVRREGLAEYGLLANRYVFGFEDRWVRGDPPQKELLGTSDIQSLADLANSFAVVSQMRIVPFDTGEAARLAAATALPLVPLLLTVFSAEELLTRLLKTMF